ncbi:family 16 glycosylhydrolase [Limimaricola pyoseonensis]|uniref:Glycosyl hydrolases family 16 n=1 Tax=Limimaricola pyoseonensis TaxID=521013 RepID=A0A1G7J0F7_9RHOB|nr:family 16 glycosylhydrolase [Limimaricola pyoseonensis]SDF18482.1 Glycosyl hydrolases family 16 [Limimaricola pyoseonensis]
MPITALPRWSRSGSALLALAVACGLMAAAPPGAARERQPGVPFRSVFPITGLDANWWVAQYDHPADWFRTGWRNDGLTQEEGGLRFALRPTEAEDRVAPEAIAADDGALMRAGKTSKPFTSGQLQRRGWYGHGRYEVILRPASGRGLITAFYVYTGPHFGDPQREIDIEFLGRDTNRVYVNRFIDGAPLEEPPWLKLGFDAADRPRLYAFEWSPERLVWYAGETEIFRLEGADEVPQPPAKIYVDLWAGGQNQTYWSGNAPEDASGEALLQCVSFVPAGGSQGQCSDLLNGS